MKQMTLDLKKGKIMERCNSYGVKALTNEELLAVITDAPVEGVSKVMETSLHDLHAKRREEIAAIIGATAASKVQCTLELSRRIAKEKAKKKLCFDNADTIAEYYMEDMRHLKQEHLLLIMLDGKLNPIAEEYLSKGTVNSALVSPRDVYIEALKREAVYIVLIHNHPSGDPHPSKFDIDITKRIDMCGKMLDIRIVDHIIIGDRKYTSLATEGVLN